MAKLLFQNPVFEPGLNLTVRRGVKWDVAEHKGVEIAAIDKPDEVLHTVDIQTQVLRFDDILTDDLLHEHDPECRTYDGLYHSMCGAYGFDFDESEIVTLVWFGIEARERADLGVGGPRGGDD